MDRQPHRSITEQLITPEIAAEFLARNIRNMRPVKPWWVKHLVRLLQRGEWQMVLPGVSFDVHGYLGDGQHRLMAIVQSGVPAMMYVQTGVTDDELRAIDQGMKRTLSDVTGIDKRVTEPLKLAASLLINFSQPTAPQVQIIADTGMQDILAALIAHSGTVRRFFSSAPTKVAAAISVMDGEPRDFVFSQYAALVKMDFDSMTSCAKALCRQVENGRAATFDPGSVLARTMRVFDFRSRNMSKIQLSETAISEAKDRVRKVLRSRIGAVTHLDNSVVVPSKQRKPHYVAAAQ
jgi:hypothetical protein